MVKSLLFAAVTANVILIIIATRELKCNKRSEREVYSSCVNGGCYGARRCSEIGRPETCVRLKKGACRAGYICKAGYLRNDNGVCIPAQQCPKQSTRNKRREHEVYSSCVNGGCYGARRCSEIGRPEICDRLNKKACRAGYVCETGYLRNDNDVCIPAQQCPKQLKRNKRREHEVYSSCMNGGCYGARRCSEKGRPETCVRLKKGACRAGYICKAGYLRNDNGVCIPAQQCPKHYTSPQRPTRKKSAPSKAPRCGKLEVPDSCVNGGCYKERECSQIIRPAICVDPIKCEQGCLCKEGYLRNKNGKCIPKNECPEKLKCPRQNEVYNPCVDKCKPNTCESIGKQYDCPFQIANEKCTGGCMCEPGYYKNKIGECISEKNCQKCTGPNEYYSCGGACDNVCETLAVRNQTHCDIINIKCNEMCYCIKGYARNKDGICVPFDQCPLKAKCGKNEELIQCPALYCKPRTCAQKGTKPFCQRISPGLPCPGSPGCVCIRGYLKGPNGDCIPEAQCPKCGKNEELIQCPALYCKPRTCAQKGTKPFCPRISPGLACPGSPGCVCKSGYLKGPNGDCIPEAQCPPRCGELEVPDSCINGGCYKERECSHIIRPTICVDPIECKQGCLCKEGYLRNKNGKCIPKNQCPEKLKCPRQNQVYNPCVDKCNPNTCESIGRQYDCPLQSANEKCTGGCVCEPGYYKNKIGECISEENCKKCTGPNEYYSCGGACDNICETLAVRNQTHCNIINIKCNEMCYCIKGYARNKDGICVPFDQCPVKAKCGKNEELIQCPSLYCKPRTCAQKGTKPICPRISPGLPCPGSPGCVCKSGYLKGPNGDCIPEAKCPPTCGINEIYSNCINGGCFGAKNCEEVDKVDVKCVKIDPKNCIKGCKCIDNYVKDKNGTCISKDQCPKKLPKCGKFEVADYCANGGCYDERKCTDIGSSYKCVRPKICVPGCLCKAGYLRDRRGDCILRRKCPNYAGSDENDSKEERKSNCDSDGEDQYDESSEYDDENNNTDTNDETNCNTANRNSTDDQNQFSKGIATFSSRFVRETAISKKNENAVMSPFSALIPLAELALYTIGRSFSQLIQAIGLQDKCQIRPVFKSYLEGTRDLENVTFNLAAMVYVNEKYEMTEAFLEDTSKVFGAGAETIDVDKPQKAADTINKWVEDHTNNKIKNLVTSDMITPDTRLLLINAVYYNGKWKYPFDPKRTTKRDFYVTADNVQKVDTMFLDTRVEYAQSKDLDCKILRLPYKNEKFTAVIILPNKIDGVDDLLDKIQDVDKYNTALQSLSFAKVKIWLPKFKISTSIDLAEILKKLGVTDIFTGQSGLTGILKSGEPIAVSTAVQKCFIDVSEEGTEAAAANAVGVSTTSVQLNPPEFNANHPFVFTLYYKADAMFTAAYRKPSTE